MAKNTDEYKKMSSEEKKLLEETMKEMQEGAKDYNSSGIGGNTITNPGVKRAHIYKGKWILQHHNKRKKLWESYR